MFDQLFQVYGHETRISTLYRVIEPIWSVTICYITESFIRNKQQVFNVVVNQRFGPCVYYCMFERPGI